MSLTISSSSTALQGNILGNAINTVMNNGAVSGTVSGSTAISSQQLSQIMGDSYQNSQNPIGSLSGNVYNDINSIFSGTNGTDVSHLIEARHDSRLFEAASAIDKQNGGNGTVSLQDLEQLRDQRDKGNPANTPRLTAMIDMLQSQGGTGTISSAKQLYGDLTSPPAGSGFSAFGGGNSVST